MAEQKIFEFRGVSDLYVAEVTQDDVNGYATETPVYLSPVAEVAKSTDSSSEAHYYDNKAMIVVNSESADTITITMAPPVLEKLAKIIGKSFDADLGMMVDSERQNKYFAIMYKTKGTDGEYRYVSRLKGQFTIPEDDNQTENDGTDTTNTQIEFTGIYTEHKFNKGIYKNGSWEAGSAKGVIVDTRYGLADVSNFFARTQTPDTVQSASGVSVTGVGLAPSTLALVEGDTATLVATVTPANASNKAVSFASSAEGYAEVDDDGVVTAVAAGSATITVTTEDGNYTDTCTVTVTAPTP